MIKALTAIIIAIGLGTSVASAALTPNGGTNGMRTNTSFVSQNLVDVEIVR